MSPAHERRTTHETTPEVTMAIPTPPCPAHPRPAAAQRRRAALSAVAVLAVSSALLSATSTPAVAAPAAPPTLAVADATSDTGLGEYDVTTLTTGQLPPRPIVVSTTLDFAPTSSVLTVNGMSFGAAQWKSTGDAGTTLSWVLDLSMAGGTSVSVRIGAAGVGGASYDRTVPVQVATEGRRTAGMSAAAPARTSPAWPGPLQFQYATPSTTPFKGLMTTASYKTRVQGDLRRNLSIDAGSGFAVIAENVVDSGIVSSRVSGAVGSSSASALSRVLVRNSTVNGNDNTAVNGSVNVVNSYITSNQDGVHPLGLNPASTPSLIAYNRIQRNGLSTAGSNGWHNDGIQMWKGSNVVISRNWISGWATSAIMLKTDQLNSDGTPLNRVRIDGNYLATTGYFTLYICSGGQGLPQYVTVTNNVFGPNRSNGASGNVAPADGLKFVRTEAQRTRAVRAGVAGAASWVVWSGNTDARTGAEIVPPGGWLAP